MAEKPLILIFTTAYKPFVGGAELAIQEISRRLHDKYNFVIITARFRRALPKEEVFLEGRIIRLGIGVPILDKLLLPFLGFVAARKIIRTQRSVLLWGVMISYAATAAFLTKLINPNISFLLTIQEGNEEWRNGFRWLGARTIWWNLIFKKVDHVICISNFLAERVREKGYKGEISIVPNGVDEQLLGIQKLRYEQNIAQRDWREHSNFSAEKYACSANNESFGIHHADADSGLNSRFVVFSASRLVYKNGIDILLEAAAILKDTFSFKIILAGDGEESQNLKLQSQKLGIQDIVEFLGNVPYEKLSEYYAKADIFIRPSRSEGLGSAFLEAMAAGLIAIGTSVGGIPDFLKDGDTGFIAKPENAGDLAAVIRKVFELSDDVKNGIIKNAKSEIVKHFLWGNIATQMDNIFVSRLTNNK